MKYKIMDLNKVLKDPELLASLLKLTLHSFSGMQTEIASLKRISRYRLVKAKIVLARTDTDDIIAWTLLSREKSKRYPTDISGALSMTFVHKKYRRLGIGSQLLKIAKRTSSPTRVIVIPWNWASRDFFKTIKGIRSYYEYIEA